MNPKVVIAIVIAAAVGGYALSAHRAEAAAGGSVVCKSFYQDFPSGFVGPQKAVQKADELGAQIAPWLSEELSAPRSRVVAHSFVPFGNQGGVELLCVHHGE